MDQTISNKNFNTWWATEYGIKYIANNDYQMSNTKYSLTICQQFIKFDVVLTRAVKWYGVIVKQFFVDFSRIFNKYNESDRGKKRQIFTGFFLENIYYKMVIYRK